MTNSGRLAFDEVIKLPPMIYGTIRWKKNIGRPTDNLCSGFAIKVEERTPLEFRDIGGGHYEVVPGTGVWKLVTESAPCSPEPEAGEDYIIRFTVPGAHVNGFPGGTYRITPALTPRWNQQLLPFQRLGFKQVTPSSVYVALTESARIKAIEFEVIRRSFFR